MNNQTANTLTAGIYLQCYGCIRRLARGAGGRCLACIALCPAALIAAAAVMAFGALAQRAHAAPEDIVPSVVTENNLIRGEAEGVFGYVNNGLIVQINWLDQGLYNYFLPGFIGLPGQTVLFETGTHDRVFTVPLSASPTGALTWVMVAGTNQVTTDDPATSSSVVRPSDGVDTFTYSAGSPALPTDRVVVRDGGKLNVAADLTVDTLSLIEGVVLDPANPPTSAANLLGGAFRVDTLLVIADGGEFRAVGGTLDTNLAIIDAGGRLVVSGGEHDLGFGLDHSGEAVFLDTTINGNITNKAGSATNIVGDVVFNGDISGPGAFFGSGTAIFNGSFAPGASPAAVPVEGSIALGDTNTLAIELAGIEPGDFDALLVQGDATLDGMLDVSLLSGFTPLVGQQFEILDVGGALSGQFLGMDEGAVAGTFGQTDLRISYAGGDGNDVVLTATSTGVPEPGTLLLGILTSLVCLACKRR
ncbi:hypothetical protein [Adhaeretor mobilis]|nr:hypothetical protein [Adhaeretor mobilis]